MQPLFVERMFQIFDIRKRGTISVGTYLDQVRDMTRGTMMEKLKFLFQVYDIESDGLLSFTELREVIKCCMQENGLSFEEREIDQMTQVLMEDAGTPVTPVPSTSRAATTSTARRNPTTGTTGLSFDQFMHLFDKSPGLMENVARSVDQCLLPPLPQSSSRRKDPFRKFRWAYIRKNIVAYFFLLAFLITCFLLTCQRFWVYSPIFLERGSFVVDKKSIFGQIARSGGLCLNFTCSIILLFVLRRCITFLRAYGFSYFLPLDNNINFHKKVGYAIAAFSLLHTIAHGLNIGEL